MVHDEFPETFGQMYPQNIQFKFVLVPKLRLSGRPCKLQLGNFDGILPKCCSYMRLGVKGDIGLDGYRYRQTHVQHVIMLLQIMFDNINRIHMLKYEYRESAE